MKRLFNKLMKLCSDNTDPFFYYKDVTSAMGTPMRIFSYRHGISYTAWERPGALSCRGIMYEMDGDVPVRCAAHPQEKFFNLGEVESTRGLDMKDALFYTFKEDGSIISTFEDKGVLGYKSMESLYSEHVEEAGIWFNGQPELKERVLQLAKDGFTCNFEYCGPKHTIIVSQQETKLVLLSIRNAKTGKYVGYDEIFADAVLRPYMVEVYDASVCSDDWVDEVRAMEDIEGYIIQFPDQKVKLKTDWYCGRHDTKSAISGKRRLAKMCVAGTTDDIRGMFVDDIYSMKKIKAFEDKYHNTLGEWYKEIIEFFEANRHHGRREYAHSASVVFKGRTYLFNIVMHCYSGYSQEMVVDEIRKTMVWSDNINLIIPSEYA